jgi:hypothetical protein
MSYLCSKCTAKTYEQKDFSLAIDETTQSSSKEENEKAIYIYIYIYIFIIYIYILLFEC